MDKRMKKILSVIMMMALGVTNIAADENTTVEEIGTVEVEIAGVKVSKNESGTKIKADLNTTLSFGFIGGVAQDKDVSIDMGQSYEIEWGDVISGKVRVGKKDFVRLGLGFDWRNYRVTDFKRFAKDGRGIITMEDYPDGVEPKFSRIHTFSLSIPLKFYHYFNKKMYFAVGPELYFTPYGSLKTRYYVNGEKQKISSGNVHQNRFSVGIGAEINIHHIGIYYKYNPFNVLRSSYGPEFSSMTTGIKVAL